MIDAFYTVYNAKGSDWLRYSMESYKPQVRKDPSKHLKSIKQQANAKASLNTTQALNKTTAGSMIEADILTDGKPLNLELLTFGCCAMPEDYSNGDQSILTTKPSVCSRISTVSMFRK